MAAAPTADRVDTAAVDISAVDISAAPTAGIVDPVPLWAAVCPLWDGPRAEAAAAAAACCRCWASRP